VYLLADADHREIATETEAGKTTLTLPSTAPDPIDSVIVMVVQ
jgi:hypothetical protein